MNKFLVHIDKEDSNEFECEKKKRKKNNIDIY